MATTYEINKGINKPVEFKGIQAQYITYLGVGLVLLLLVFATVYALGIGIYYCLAIVGPLAGLLIGTIQHLSKTYGPHGLTRRMAGRRIPGSIRSSSRSVFTTLKSPAHATVKSNGSPDAHL